VRAGALGVAVLLVAALAPPGADGRAVVEKVTWSSWKGVTRLALRGSAPIRVEVARPSEAVLRIDLLGADAAGVPRTLVVDTAEVSSVVRVPREAAALPPGVDERFLVRLRRTDVAWDVEPLEDGCTVLVGDAARLPPAGKVVTRPSLTAEAVKQPDLRDVEPTEGERLVPALPFVVGEEQPVRTGPSALHPAMGRVRAGETRIADARKGPWVHLTSQGWILQATTATGGRAAAGTTPSRRAPFAWTVITLGTGLALDVTEVPAGGDPAAEHLVSLFVPSPRAVRFDVRLGGPADVGVRLPPKEGRLVFGLAGGRRVDSLDPRKLVLRPGATGAHVDELFPSPVLLPGEAWSTFVLVPADVDLAAVTDVQVDVDGRLQRMFRVPGSGEAVP
jgi:hypothetical protein